MIHKIQFQIFVFLQLAKLLPTKVSSFNIYFLPCLVGGSDKYRPHWSKFVKDTVLLLYLIDSSDAASLQSSLDALYIILQVKELDGAEVIIVFTKTDNELDGFVDETMRELNSGRFGRTGFLYTGVQVQSGGAPSTKGIIELQQRLLECVAGSKVVNR